MTRVIPDLQTQLAEHTSYFDNAQDLSKLFCSELVAALYQRLGVLPSHPAASNYTPKSFATENIPFLNGAVLGPLEFVRQTRKSSSSSQTHYVADIHPIVTAGITDQQRALIAKYGSAKLYQFLFLDVCQWSILVSIRAWHVVSWTQVFSNQFVGSGQTCAKTERRRQGRHSFAPLIHICLGRRHARLCQLF